MNTHMIRRWAAIAALGVACPVVQLSAASVNNRPINEELTTSAWDAYKGGQFEEAIRRADECLKLFDSDARSLQDELKEKKTPSPKIGKTSDSERDEILGRGPLNDVATCFFIKGETYSKMAEWATGAEHVRLLAAAKKAYEEAAHFTYARCWDPRGWFWDPARTANNRLRSLSPIRT